MFYKVKVKDHIRIPPNKFGLDLKQAVIEQLKEKYGGYISKELGLIIDVSGLIDVGEGIIIPGDGASYYQSTFELLTFEPEMQEVIPGKIRDIADFGAFITMGPIDGMIHISQTINDFVSFSKDKVLQGKDSKRSLKVNDKCRARIIQVSYKDIANPKIGLTMRQQGLGRDDWIQEDLNKTAGKTKKVEEKKEKKK
ncbi:MAG: DNA-directed RNA polymerase [Nanoarchaeota archaeon]|nr:DNA-directed RNA polymerase [Nanoarchaeota archaeon]